MPEDALPGLGLSPYESASRLRSQIEAGVEYARGRRHRFRVYASATKWLSLVLSAASTVILGLQDLNFWASLAFSFVAITTVINSIEPYFNWRSRWVLMEELQAGFYRTLDELDYELAKRPPDQLQHADLDQFFSHYQYLWTDVSRRWLDYRRREEAGGRS